jgi:hypothetical protein
MGMGDWFFTPVDQLYRGNDVKVLLQAVSYPPGLVRSTNHKPPSLSPVTARYGQFVSWLSGISIGPPGPKSTSLPLGGLHLRNN